MVWAKPRARRGDGIASMLALLRAAVIVLVLLAMLRPTLIYTQTKKQAATLVVLVDQSRSMSVPDAVGNKTRWEALRGAVADAAPALAKLQRDFELKAYTFDADVHEVAGGGRQDRTARQARRASKPPSGPPWTTCWGARRASGCWAWCC